MDTEQYLIETEEERTRKSDAVYAAKMSEIYLDHAKNGKGCLVVDQRIGEQSTILFRGVTFEIEGYGQPYKPHLHTLRRAYIRSWTVTERTAGHLHYWRNRESEEAERWQHEFNKMMEDENNDGVNPPRPESSIIREIVKAMHTEQDAALLRIQAQSEISPETKTGWIQSQYAKRALEAHATGKPMAEVIALAADYQNDPEYCDAVLGM